MLSKDAHHLQSNASKFSRTNGVMSLHLDKNKENGSSSPFMLINMTYLVCSAERLKSHISCSTAEWKEEWKCTAVFVWLLIHGVFAGLAELTQNHFLLQQKRLQYRPNQLTGTYYVLFNQSKQCPGCVAELQLLRCKRLSGCPCMKCRGG